MRPNATQLDLLRTKPQRTRLYLGIYKPTSVLACQLNGLTAAKGDRVISYDNVTTGSHLLVETGMTLYVGTTPGSHDRGRIRVKSIVSGQITVAENDYILWADNLYLTVVSFFEPWGIYPRIDLVGSTPIYYKDYDIPYVDQNENMNPVVAMGPNYAGFIQTGSMGVFYSSSGTFDPADNSIPTGYAWLFEGGIPTASSVAHPGPVQYVSPGHFTTRLTVTSNQGKTETGHRHIMAFKKPGEGAETPILNWGFDSIQGSRDQYGYNVGFWLREQADFSKVVEGALLVIFAEHFYGSVKGLLGGNALDKGDILFCGYIEDESIRYNYYTSRLEFRAASITQIMDYKGTFSVALNDATAPAYWYEMTKMTVDKAVVHYLKWHSTILNITDFSKVSDDRRLAFADFSRGSLFGASNELYQSALLAQMTADRQGKIWSEVNINSLPTGIYSGVVTGSRPDRLSMELLKTDWIDEVDIRVREHPDLSYVEAGGIVYNPDAPSGTVFPYLSGAPGDAPGYEGPTDKINSLLISSQQDLDVIAGLAFANSAGRYPEITLRAAGAYSNFDIAPQEQVQITLGSSDTWRQLIWVKKRFIVRAVNWNFDPGSESLTPDLSLEEETAGPPGDPIIIPVEAPYQDNDLPDWDLDFPPLIPLPGITPPIFPQPGSGNLVYAYIHRTPNILVRSRNFQSSSPTWTIVPLPAAVATGTHPGIHFYLSYVDPINIAFIWASGNDDGSWPVGTGIQGYLTNNLNAAIPSWTRFWTDSDSINVLGSPAQPAVGFIDQVPSLGYHIGIFQHSVIGTSPRFVYGGPGTFASVQISTTHEGTNPNQIPRLVHLGGSSIAGTNNSSIMRSDNLGLSQLGWNRYNINSRGVRAAVFDSAGMCFEAQIATGTTTGMDRLWFDYLSFASLVGTPYDRMVDLVPVIGGVRCRPINGGSHGWHAGKAMDFVNGSFYASLTGGSQAYFAKKAPGISPWSLLASLTTFLYPIEPLIGNPLIWAALQHTSPVIILGSSDGGGTWVSRMGNILAVTALANLSTFDVTLKFPVGAA